MLIPPLTGQRLSGPRSGSLPPFRGTNRANPLKEILRRSARNFTSDSLPTETVRSNPALLGFNERPRPAHREGLRLARQPQSGTAVAAFGHRRDDELRGPPDRQGATEPARPFIVSSPERRPTADRRASALVSVTDHLKPSLRTSDRDRNEPIRSQQATARPSPQPALPCRSTPCAWAVRRSRRPLTWRARCFRTDSRRGCRPTTFRRTRPGRR